MSEKILNLDELVQIQPTLTWKDKQYPMREMTLKGFLETQKKASELEKAAKEEGNDEDHSENEAMRESLSVISSSFPGISEDDLMTMTFRQIRAIMNFITEVSTMQADEGNKTKKS